MKFMAPIFENGPLFDGLEVFALWDEVPQQIEDKGKVYLSKNDGRCKRRNGMYLHCRHVLRSVQFSHSVMSNSLPPHELQHARPPCLSVYGKVLHKKGKLFTGK